MNIERLNQILEGIVVDEQKLKIKDKLNNFAATLDQVISNPAHPTFQDNFKKNKAELFKALDDSEVNSFPKSWIEILNEISNNEFIFGSNLKFSIEEVISNNNITLANAGKELKAIQMLVSDFYTNADSMLNAMGNFNILPDYLDSGDCELSYMIPRKYIDNNLDGYDKEIGTLKYIINTISESVTSDKQDIKIKSISSSELLIYLIIVYQVADKFLDITNKILETYERILTIKQKVEELKQLKLTKKVYEPVGKSADGLMEKEIKTLSKNIIKDYKGNGQRKNELENGLNSAIQKYAKRLDNGFKAEIRIEPLDKPKEGEDIPKEKLKLVETFKSIQDKIDAKPNVIIQDHPILNLPEGDNGEDKN